MVSSTPIRVGGISRRIRAEIGALRIFAKRKFDSGQRAFKWQSVCRLAPAQLDDYSLATNCICGTVKDVGGGHSSCQIAINGDVVGIKYIGDVHHGGNGDASFIHIAIDRDVRVAIDHAGHHKLP